MTEKLNDEIMDERYYAQEIFDLVRKTPDKKKLANALSYYHDNDIASALSYLTPKERKHLYDSIGIENTSRVFAYIDEDVDKYFAELEADQAADILEEMGLESVGAPGTTAALALLNDQVKKGGVMASSYVGGLSGAFIPVSEDQGMIDAVEKGALTIEKLEAMTCVCSVGLDMIAIPGDVPASAIAGIIADEAAIGMVNNKTTAVRIIPVIGKGVGEQVEFGGLLGYAPIMPINRYGCSEFIARGGRIPAPIHSFKN